MFSRGKQFRRPDGTLYEPSSFSVRQYEEQYVRAGVQDRLVVLRILTRGKS